jgi:hypothetical protein
MTKIRVRRGVASVDLAWYFPTKQVASAADAAAAAAQATAVAAAEAARRRPACSTALPSLSGLSAVPCRGASGGASGGAPRAVAPLPKASACGCGHTFEPASVLRSKCGAQRLLQGSGARRRLFARPTWPAGDYLFRTARKHEHFLTGRRRRTC